MLHATGCGGRYARGCPAGPRLVGAECWVLAVDTRDVAPLAGVRGMRDALASTCREGSARSSAE